MKNAPFIIVGIIIFFSFMYGVYWVGKTVSYKLFYEGMVREEIAQMVKPEALK